MVAIPNTPELSNVGLVCPACGYDLRGLSQHRCPECGTAFDPAKLSMRNNTCEQLALVASLASVMTSAISIACLYHLVWLYAGEIGSWCGTGLYRIGEAIQFMGVLVFVSAVFWAYPILRWSTPPRATLALRTARAFSLASAVFWATCLNVATLYQYLG